MYPETCSLSTLWASTPLVFLAAFHNPGGGSCHPHIPGQEPSPLSEVTWQGRRGLAASNLSSWHEDAALCHPPPGWQQMEGNCPPAAVLASAHSYRVRLCGEGLLAPFPLPVPQPPGLVCSPQEDYCVPAAPQPQERVLALLEELTTNLASPQTIQCH